MDIAFVGEAERSNPLIYWSLGLAILSFVWTVAWSWWTYKRSAIQDYWFSEVVGPRTVAPLLNFYEKWLPWFRSCSGDGIPEHVVADLSTFGEEKDLALRSLWISKLLFNGMYEFACQKLDEVEDKLSGEIGKVCIAERGGAACPDFEGVSRCFEDATLSVLSKLAQSRANVRSK